jgi:hypothetical protein
LNLKLFSEKVLTPNHAKYANEFQNNSFSCILRISRSKNSSLINQLRNQFTARRAKEQDSVAKRRTEIISIPNPEGIESFSPALADAIGLRRVTKQNGGNPERVESNGANGDATLSGLEIFCDVNPG